MRDLLSDLMPDPQTGDASDIVNDVSALSGISSALASSEFYV